MKHQLSVILLVFLTPPVFAQDTLVRFTESASLLKAAALSKGMAECQPLKGDTAQVLQVSKAAGTEIAHVRVLSGRCKNAEGWAGWPRLEAVTGNPGGSAAADMVRFSVSSSLLNTSDPGKGLAACQPLRGDAAQMLQVTKTSGVDIARVRVLSGRCKDIEGWAGLARLEPGAAPAQ